MDFSLLVFYFTLKNKNIKKVLKAFTKAGGCVIIVIVKICVKKEELIVQKAYLILENGTIFEGKSFGCSWRSYWRNCFYYGYDRLSRNTY